MRVRAITATIVSVATVALAMPAYASFPAHDARSASAKTVLADDGNDGGGGEWDGMTPDQILAVKTAVPVESIPELAGSVGTSSRGAAKDTVCAFAANGDYVHRSTYDGVMFASGHGWWENYTCPETYRANVTIYLEEKLGSHWYVQGNAGTKNNTFPGSGSVNRANAKVECVNTESHDWRSQVSATIVGHADSAPVATTPINTINCY
jgi:hypothetical protein